MSDLRFPTKRKCLQKICIIVKKENIVLIARRTRNRGYPQIIVNNIKGHSTMRIRRKGGQFNLFTQYTELTNRRGNLRIINGLRST